MVPMNFLASETCRRTPKVSISFTFGVRLQFFLQIWHYRYFGVG